MKEYFNYYLANHGKLRGQNIVTVVTLMEGMKFGRGVSVCSPGDTPDPTTEEGTFHAKNYALRALKGRSDVLITDDRAIYALMATDCPFIYHSQTMPILTWQEKRFFFGKAKFLGYKKGFVQTYRKPFFFGGYMDSKMIQQAIDHSIKAGTYRGDRYFLKKGLK